MTKKKLYRAGLVLYHLTPDSEIRMLFMVPSDPKYGGDSPQIPKGKIEEGETAEEAAVREAKEEVGLFPPNIDGPLHNLGTFLGRTTFFVAKIKDPNQFGKPGSESKSVRWMSPEQFESEGRILHKPVVKAIVRLIKDKEDLK